MAGRPRKSGNAPRSRTPSVAGEKPLAGRVAVVAGATRGAGRGIARALGEAGATVYCTGRSVRGNRSPYNRPETVDETAEMIRSAGGSASAHRVDHTSGKRSGGVPGPRGSQAGPPRYTREQEVTENDILSAGGNPITQVVKFALKGLALNMAAELRPQRPKHRER